MATVQYGDLWQDLNTTKFEPIFNFNMLSAILGGSHYQKQYIWCHCLAKMTDNMIADQNWAKADQRPLPSKLEFRIFQILWCLVGLVFRYGFTGSSFNESPKLKLHSLLFFYESVKINAKDCWCFSLFTGQSCRYGDYDPTCVPQDCTDPNRMSRCCAMCSNVNVLPPMFTQLVVTPSTESPTTTPTPMTSILSTLSGTFLELLFKIGKLVETEVTFLCFVVSPHQFTSTLDDQFYRSYFDSSIVLKVTQSFLEFKNA